MFLLKLSFSGYEHILKKAAGDQKTSWFSCKKNEELKLNKGENKQGFKLSSSPLSEWILGDTQLNPKQKLAGIGKHHHVTHHTRVPCPLLPL